MARNLNTSLKKDKTSSQSVILKNMRKEIVTRFLDTLVLAKLKKAGSLNGYEALRFIHNKYDLMISAGTIYSVFYSLERKGLIKGKVIGNKREYTLTERGLETIETILNYQKEIHNYLALCIIE